MTRWDERIFKDIPKETQKSSKICVEHFKMELLCSCDVIFGILKMMMTFSVYAFHSRMLPISPQRPATQKKNSEVSAHTGAVNSAATVCIFVFAVGGGGGETAAAADKHWLLLGILLYYICAQQLLCFCCCLWPAQLSRNFWGWIVEALYILRRKKKLSIEQCSLKSFHSTRVQNDQTLQMCCAPLPPSIGTVHPHEGGGVIKYHSDVIYKQIWLNNNVPIKMRESLKKPGYNTFYWPLVGGGGGEGWFRFSCF